MSIEHDTFNLIVVSGTIQGFVAAAVLWFYSSCSSGKKLLSAILFTLALLNIKILLHTLGLWKHQGWGYLPLAIDTFIQQLFYLYTCYLTEKNFSFKLRHLWHLVPVFIFEFHAIVVYLVTVLEPDIRTKYIIVERYLFYTMVKWIEDFLALFFAGFYWLLCFKKINSYRRRLLNNPSAVQHSEQVWLHHVLIGSGILVVMLFFYSLPANILGHTNSVFYLKVFYIYITLLIYFLTFRGYHTLLTFDTKVLQTPDGAFIEEIECVPVHDIYSHTEDDENNFLDIQFALIEVMETQSLYLEPELSLKDISKRIGFPVGQVSAAINAKFGFNFRTWVNGYRINEVKKRLDDPQYSNLNIAGIAYECGFNSEASFYRIFKQCTGYSPKSYLKEINRTD